jgi:peptidyl-prolyl cis-trans isomerase B (cyclophilin B)
MRLIKGILGLLTLFTLHVGVDAVSEKAMAENLKATVETSKGTIEVDLYADQTPITVANFVNLAKRGFYDGLLFHRVIPNFMVQGGDPEGKGYGGPGYKFQDEFVPTLKHDSPGILSMANAGPGTNGSQFFVTHVPTPWLDGKHTIFGKVTKGQDIVNAIQQGDKITKITVTGKVDEFLASAPVTEKVKGWNAVLDTKFPARG